MKQKQAFTIKDVVAIGVGAALFVVIAMIPIPAPAPNTNIQLQYALQALFSCSYCRFSSLDCLCTDSNKRWKFV